MMRKSPRTCKGQIKRLARETVEFNSILKVIHVISDLSLTLFPGSSIYHMTAISTMLNLLDEGPTRYIICNEIILMRYVKKRHLCYKIYYLTVSKSQIFVPLMRRSGTWTFKYRGYPVFQSCNTQVSNTPIFSTNCSIFSVFCQSSIHEHNIGFNRFILKLLDGSETERRS